MMLLVSTTRSRCMPTIPPLVIAEEERAELQRRVRAHTTPQRAAKRARVVLLAADGVPNRQIAPIVGMNQHTVAHWRRRFAAERRAGRWSTATTSGCGSWPR
jgi:FixJ family two-component response regulator